MNPIFRALYTKEELEEKVEQYIADYERLRKKKDYRLMAFECYDIGRLFELLKEKKQREYYFQKIVDDWNAHPEKISELMCVVVLKLLNRPEEALRIVLIHPEKWMPITLAHLYQQLDRKDEACLLFAGLANHSVELSEAYYQFWRPHYLQDAAEYWKEAGHTENARMYNQRAIEGWEEIMDNIKKHLHPIEEAWLFEEVGYLYERASRYTTAMKYYEKATSRYDLAYTENNTEIYTEDGNIYKYLFPILFQQIELKLDRVRCQCQISSFALH